MQYMKENEQQVPVFLKWMILFLAVCSYLMGFIVRFSWPPIVSLASPELGIDMTRAGLYMSAFYIGYVLTHIPAGLFADRFGVRFLIAAALFLEGVSSLAMAYIGSFSPGFFLRILAGLAAGTVYAACVRSVTTWFLPKERGIAFGLLMLAPTAGVLVANQIAAVVLAVLSWRSIFIVVGAAAVVLGILVLFFMRERGHAARDGSVIEGLKFLLHNKNIMRMAYAGFCLMWVQIGFISWGNTAMKTAGLTLENAGFVMTIFGIGGIFGPLASGYLADRMRNKKTVLIIGFAFLVPMVLLFGRMHSFIAFSVVACILGFIFGYINTFMPLLVSEYSGRKWAASAGGLTGCIFQIGAIIGPAVVGFSIDMTGTFTLAWWLLAAGPALSLFFLVRLDRLAFVDGQ